ncbi:2-dehydropantoate 2-reductase [Terribacillus saccharophilus]|uniref:2-dehydropantoate 2-reductase n=1 Tax=Terribacillus saccharophilus TaxID=361277 RepID=UPI002989A242|nr:2-dehydropantoate 2-reductase [Terribacillus saccharophilus]MCM3225029.1 2-dehydropantoate 2-reductase [Terribacillus saccharophilus]
MKINVIGGGAIGLLAAAKLGRFHDVRLLTRTREQSDEITVKGLHLGDEVITVEALPAADWQDLGQPHVWIVCVKQYDLQAIWEKLKLHANAAVVFLQNGMNHTDFLQEEEDFDYPLIVGSVEHGALRINSHTVEHTGEAAIRLADLSDLYAEVLVNRLHKPDFPILFEKNWHMMLGTKLIANAVINPLTAIYRVKNGELLEHPAFERIAKVLCNEAADALGLEEEQQWANVRRIINATKANLSSMHRDIQAGRQTEIESISGYVRDHAKQAVPYTDFVYYSILGLTKQQERTYL